MKAEITAHELTKLPIVSVLTAMALLSVILIGIIDSSAILASAQVSKTIPIF
ncbi:MAG TPA: hypothetical protein VKA95_16815 [Nitrososphaeraceae archaeon]|jgi:hypothetical protein|nr:hypothetical protein [Nitrososphaeraceae archaeon]